MDQSVKKNAIKKGLIEWIKTIGIAVVIAFLLNQFVISNSHVPSSSMEPTIMTDSRIIGSRLSYRFSDVERGDIAVFIFGWRCPSCQQVVEGENQDSCSFCNATVETKVETVYYVKRVIGVPGDIIDINNHSVYLNNSKEPLEEPYLPEQITREESYHFEVPENSYFMLGDNRNNSMDARYWQTPYIAKDKIVAKVLFEYFPQIKRIR